jgi:hypothetical protein
MPTKSEESDLRWDRIEAREIHYQQCAQASPQPQTTKKRIDSIELGAIGAHLEDAPENESYPERIDDFATNDALHPSCDSVLKLCGDSFHDQPDSVTSVSDKVSTAAACTPKWGPYLPPSEMKEARRQLWSNSKSVQGLLSKQFVMPDDNSVRGGQNRILLTA